MTTEKGARAVSILRQGLGIRQVSSFFPENVYKSLSPADKMSQLKINQTEHIICRSPGISYAGIQRSVACTDEQRNRYVLL